MAKTSDHTFELLFVGVVGVGAYLLARRQMRFAPAGGYDALGNPAGAYGVGSLSYQPGYYGPGQADTVPNVINAFANLFNSAGQGPLLTPSLPLGQAGVTNPPPYF